MTVQVLGEAIPCLTQQLGEASYRYNIWLQTPIAEKKLKLPLTPLLERESRSLNGWGRRQQGEKGRKEKFEGKGRER